MVVLYTVLVSVIIVYVAVHCAPAARRRATHSAAPVSPLPSILMAIARAVMPFVFCESFDEQTMGGEMVRSTVCCVCDGGSGIETREGG